MNPSITIRSRAIVLAAISFALIVSIADVWAQSESGEKAGTEAVDVDIVEMSPARGGQVRLVTIDNSLGDVRVEGTSDIGISIRAVKRAPDAATLERMKVQLVPDATGAVTIRTTLKSSDETKKLLPGSVSIDLVVRLPRGAAVDAAVWKGVLAVAGLNNGAQLQMQLGTIETNNVRGTVSAQTQTGNVHLKKLNGDIFASTVNGNIDGERLSGNEMSAYVLHGNVHLQDIDLQKLMIAINQGDALLERLVRIPTSLKVGTYRGHIAIRLGTSPGGFRLRTWAPRGKVSIAQNVHKRVVSAAETHPEQMQLSAIIGNITVSDF